MPCMGCGRCEEDKWPEDPNPPHGSNTDEEMETAEGDDDQPGT